MTYSLRVSRARWQYVCAICEKSISKGETYVRDEPHPRARMFRGQQVRHICIGCIEDFERMMLWFRGGTSDRIVVPQRIEWVDTTELLIQRLVSDWEEIYSLTDEQFERLIADRLEASGCSVIRVGRTNQKDGGIDIIFTTPGKWSVLGAAQVKHHRSPTKTTGAGDVRNFAGSIHSQPFNFGVIVTNTTFTPDAQWAANQHVGKIGLRNGTAVQEWVRDNFLSNELWRPIPKKIQLCPGIVVDLSKIT